MKNQKIIYKNNIQSKYLSLTDQKKIGKKLHKILKEVTIDLEKTQNTLHSLSKKFTFSFKFKELNKFKKFKTLVIIGMGGSILGAEALYFFFKKKIKKDFIFLNDIDEDKLKLIKKEKDFSKTLFIIISKSGNTIETISNFFVLDLIKKNSKNVIIISEKNNNPLYLLSKKMNLKHIDCNNYIGGRYSVLSEVGIVPAYLMGLDIRKLRKNLLNPLKFKNQKFLRNSTLMLSDLLKAKKFKNLIFFNYEPKLDKFLYWGQQLIAESLGKNGKGFLPLISKAPKDHHSLLQLYLEGPRDKIFYIFSSKISAGQKIKIKQLDNRIKFVNNKSLDQIKNAQKEAFIKVLKKNQIPFREFRIGDFSETILGELFSYLMLETAIIGKLSSINPYNQPAVEQVKINTKKLLS